MINRRNFLKASGVVLASLSLGCFGAQESGGAAKKPNLLFIFSDDQRWDRIGYMSKFVSTPNLDKISAQGIRFNQAFITLPVCSPSRATALTGRYAMANGVTDYQNELKDTEVSFASYLNQADYLTAMVGKWHVPGRHANSCEFQEIHQLGGMAPYWNPPVFDNGKRRVYSGLSTDYCVEQTIEVMKKSQGEGKPFGIWLCPQAPHGRSKKAGGNWLSEETREYYDNYGLSTLPVPGNINDDLDGKPEFLKTYRGRRVQMSKGPMTTERYRNQVGYFGQITEMDRSLGKLFEALNEMGLRENTYIVFMGDNGLFSGEHGFMSKALHYEESIRVPLFVVGPGIKPGYDESLVTNADIAPTILDLAGIKVPENMHGLSLKKTLLNRKRLEREFALFELPEEIKVLETKTAYSLRSDRWKYIQTFENGNDKPYTFEELYDLQADQFEMTNLVNQPEHANFIIKLRAELNKQRRQFAQ